MTLSSQPTVRSADTPSREELAFLLELCEVVASSSDLQIILDWMVSKTTALLSADEGSIRLLGREQTRPTMKTLARSGATEASSSSWPLPIAMGVMQYLTAHNEPLTSPDLVVDPRFPALSEVDSRIRSILAVPLRVEGRLTGLLAVTQSTPGRRWTRKEVQLLSIVASNSAGVIEQARLRAEAFDKQQLEEEARRLISELHVAREIQMGMLPSHPLQCGSWRVGGQVIPARQVGGDAYDHRLLGDQRFSFTIADVAGKGAPAALLMSNLLASLHAFCNGRASVPEAIRNVNRSVCRWVASDRFITLFYGEVDLERGILTYINAGHNLPLLRRRDGTMIELSEGGPPVGVLQDASYTVGEVPIGAGDAVLAYSDGVSDAQNLHGQTFGEDRLRQLWGHLGGTAPAVALEVILAQVASFRGAAPQNDDMTIVVVGQDDSAGR